MKNLTQAALAIFGVAALVGPLAYASGPTNPDFTREVQTGNMVQSNVTITGSLQIYPTPGATPNGDERAITVCLGNGTNERGAVICMPTPNGTAAPAACATPNGQQIGAGACITYNSSAKGRYVVAVPNPAGTATVGVTIER